MVYNVSCCPRALPSQGHTHTGARALRRSQYMASQGHRQSGAVPSKTLNSPFIDMLGILHQDQQSCFSPCSVQHTHTDTYTSSATQKWAGSQGWISWLSEGELISKSLCAIKVSPVLLNIIFQQLLMLSDLRRRGIGTAHCFNGCISDLFLPYSEHILNEYSYIAHALRWVQHRILCNSLLRIDF